jgi:hypothetical protein
MMMKMMMMMTAAAAETICRTRNTCTKKICCRVLL